MDAKLSSVRIMLEASLITSLPVISIAYTHVSSFQGRGIIYPVSVHCHDRDLFLNSFHYPQFMDRVNPGINRNPFNLILEFPFSRLSNLDPVRVRSFSFKIPSSFAIADAVILWPLVLLYPSRLLIVRINPAINILVLNINGFKVYGCLSIYKGIFKGDIKYSNFFLEKEIYNYSFFFTKL